MANNNTAAEKKAEKQRLAAEKKAEKERLAAEKAETDSEVKTFKIKPVKELGFEKRNYFVGNKNILIIADGEVSEEDYNLFNDHAKKIFFV